MGWSEIIKAVNSNISVPLNKLITSAKDSLDASITSAKNELSTLIKKNGTSYPNVTTGTILKNERLEVSGKGKITFLEPESNGGFYRIVIDGVEVPRRNYINPSISAFTFEKSLYLAKLDSYDYGVTYILQLTE